MLLHTSQLDQFREYIKKLKWAVGEENANKILSKSLYLVVAGSDDLANTYFTIGTRRQQYEMASHYCPHKLYRLGARRIAVFGILPIGCWPFQRTLAGGSTRFCAEEYNQAAQLVNAKLSPTLDSLTQSLPQSRVVYVDIYNPLLDLIKYPQKYVGLKLVTGDTVAQETLKWSYCATDIVGHVQKLLSTYFWDSYHPTETAYKVLVDQIIQKYINLFM
ncbi:hypothetical protein OROHE_023526 [Orobanche hederae]